MQLWVQGFEDSICGAVFCICTNAEPLGSHRATPDEVLLIIAQLGMLSVEDDVDGIRFAFSGIDEHDQLKLMEDVELLIAERRR